MKGWVTASDIAYAVNDERIVLKRAEVWHGSWVEEQKNPNYENLGMEPNQERYFYTEQDIELFDWGHSRAVADLSWTFDDASLIDCWKPFQLIFAENGEIYSTLEDYHNEGIENLEKVGFSQE